MTDQPPSLTPEQARQRASVVALTFGALHVLGAVTLISMRAASEGWTAGDAGAGLSGMILPLASGIAGLVYVMCAWPIRRQILVAAWVGMAAALIQMGVFASLVVLTIVAALRMGNPGRMTMGVLVFGTMGFVHLFVFRWLWQSRV